MEVSVAWGGGGCTQAMCGWDHDKVSAGRRCSLAEVWLPWWTFSRGLFCFSLHGRRWNGKGIMVQGTRIPFLSPLCAQIPPSLSPFNSAFVQKSQVPFSPHNTPGHHPAPPPPQKKNPEHSWHVGFMSARFNFIYWKLNYYLFVAPGMSFPRHITFLLCVFLKIHSRYFPL